MTKKKNLIKTKHKFIFILFAIYEVLFSTFLKVENVTVLKCCFFMFYYCKTVNNSLPSLVPYLELGLIEVQIVMNDSELFNMSSFLHHFSPSLSLSFSRSHAVSLFLQLCHLSTFKRASSFIPLAFSKGMVVTSIC